MLGLMLLVLAIAVPSCQALLRGAERAELEAGCASLEGIVPPMSRIAAGDHTCEGEGRQER